MNRTCLLSAFVALIASTDRCLAQGSSSLPVIQPKLTELGEFRDSSLFLKLFPEESSLSPRGTLIAYIGWDDNIRIWNVRTHTNRVAVNQYSQSLAWSPVGDAIAFVHSDDGPQDHVWTLRLDPVTGESIGNPRRVSLAAANGSVPQFSPDGKSIAFSRKDAGRHSSLVVVPTAGGTERVLASGYAIQNLRWAVDGSYLHYVSYQDSAKTKAMLTKVMVNGGVKPVTHDLASVTGWTLSADNRVVMQSQPELGGDQAVKILDHTGRNLATLSVPADVAVADWSGAYRQLGVRHTIPRSLRVVNIADGKSRELIDSTADVQAVAWFADNRRVAAIVFKGGIGSLVTMNTDGTGRRTFPLVVQPMWGPTVGHGFALHLSVSPDGRYAVYQGPGRHSLELVDLSGDKQRTLTRAGDVNQPFWLSDSRTIRYMRIAEVPQTDPGWRGVHDATVDGTDKLVRAFPQSQYPTVPFIVGENFVSIFGGTALSLARLDGTPDQLLMRGASSRNPGAVSPDGRTMLATKGPIGSPKATGKVTLFALSDGSQRTINLPFADIGGCGDFSLNGRFLYCRGRETEFGLQTLYEVPVDGSKPRVVTRIDTREFMGANERSPDGKWFLQTVTGVRRSAFVSMDFTDGMNRLLTSAGTP